MTTPPATRWQRRRGRAGPAAPASREFAPRAKRVAVGAVPIDVVTAAQALQTIEARIDQRQSGAVFTPNVDHLVLARQSPDFRAAYGRAALSLVDGAWVFWLARLAGKPLPEKISGSDLLLPLMELAASRGFRVFLLGGGRGVAEEAARVLRQRLPALQIVGTAAPAIGAGPESQLPAGLVETLREAAPDLLVVALGAPKQEYLVDRLLPLLDPCVALAVGAALDFLTGHQSRAPAWVSKVGLEWSYRLAREPRRLAHRYLWRDAAFLAIVGDELWRRGRELAGSPRR